MIIFESVTKQFGDDSVALDDVSFQIGEGEFVVVTGHSGSGKTTLMRLLTKEYLPTSGEIVFNDVPLSSIKTSQVHHHRRQLGIVFQDYKLLPELNVWENIALALNIVHKKQSEVEMRVTDLLRLVDLVDKAFLFPSQLSGGEAQRVSIARALATAPKVIFADEPTGNLDPETSTNIAKLLEKINDLGTTVIIATHDISVMDVLTKERHLQLERGKIVKDTGTPKSSAHPAPKKHAEPEVEEDSEDENEEVEPKPRPKSEPKADDAEKPDKSDKHEAKTDQAKAEEPPKKKGFGFPKFKLPFGKKAKPTDDSKSDEPITEPSAHTLDKGTDKVSVKVETLE